MSQVSKLLALLLATALASRACSSSRDPPDAKQLSDDTSSVLAESEDPPGAPVSIDSYLAVGETLYFRGDHDSARSVWNAALERARAQSDSIAEARLLTWLGIVAWKVGDFPEARRVGERALVLKRRLGLKPDLFKSYNALGLLAWHEGRLRDALALFEAAAQAAQAVGDVKGLAAVSGNLALVYTELGEFEEARRGFLAAREGGRAIRDARIEANALSNLGMLSIRVGDPRGGIPYFLEARPLYQSIGYVAGEQHVLGQLGTAYDALGEPRLAIAVLDTALRQSRTLGLRQEEASNLEALARVYREAGDYRRALQLYAESKAINAELGLAVETGADLRAEAKIHAALGDLELARRYAEEALRIHRTVGARFEQLAGLLLLAEVLEKAGHASEATRYLEAAGQVASRLDARDARIEVALAEARIADRSSEPQRVLRALDAVQPDLSTGAYTSQWEAHALRSRAYARLGRLEEAVAAGRRAVEAVERIRSNFGSGMLRTAYLSARTRTYADLVGVLVSVGQLDEAFEVSDAARGRALLEHLAAKPEGFLTDPTARALQEGEALLRRIDGLVSQIASMQKAPGEEPDSTTRATLRLLYDKLAAVRGEYEGLLARAVERDATTAAFLGAAQPSAAQVQAALRPDEFLLEYLVAADRVFLFVVSSKRVRSVRVDVSPENLFARIRVAREYLSGPERASSPSPSVLGALHEVLVGAAKREGLLDGARRLIVVPYGVLTYVPFAALRDAASGRYLAEDYSLIFLPSAAALPLLRQRSVTGPGSTDGGLRAVVFAPFPEALPATGAEARAVRDAFQATEVRLGGRATERALRRAMRRGIPVHLATHGLLNPANPMFSRVELARGADNSSEDDGRLEAHELLNLSVRAPLVFLSGCETGLGAAWSTEFARGEDYATLAQAFLYAGARNVIATLWRVEDQGAAAFAERFYRLLGTTEPAEVLAKAQRQMIRDPRFHAPYYWAAYVLAGEGRWEGGAQKDKGLSVKNQRGASTRFVHKY